MNLDRVLLFGLVAVTSMMFASGCYSRLTSQGGHFTVGYQTDVEIENFNKPLAPGSKLDLVVFINGEEDTLPVISARSSKSTVLSVSVKRGLAVLSAKEPGQAEIELVVRMSNGEEVKDSVVMNVARPARLELTHGCTEGLVAVYPANSRVAIPFDMWTTDGRAVIGYDYFPVKASPDDALRLVGRSKQWSEFIFETGASRDDVTLRSTIDAGVLKLRLAELGAIDDFILDPFDTHTKAVAGHKTFVEFVPMVGDAPLCMSKTKTKARSLTPEICTVRVDLEEDGADHNLEQLVIIAGVKFGVCRYEVSLPQADNGRGLSRTFRIAVGSFPDVDEEGRADDPPADEQRPEKPWWLAAVLGLVVPLMFAPLLWLRRR